MNATGSPAWCTDHGDTGAFPPPLIADTDEIAEILRQDPATRIARSRWRLADLPLVLPALTGYTVSGLSKLLKRRRIRLKRGRLRQHSPDPAYAAKNARILRALALARAHPTRITVVYGDEASFYRQPTLAPVWASIGTEPTALLSHHSNTRYRLCGGLDAVTGQVIRLSASKITVSVLTRFLQALRAAYPDRYLFLVWDNWPVHRHPTVLAEAARLHIRILWLPTYAPWLNPIEKLWRWLKADVLHHHRLADRWDDLKAAIATFLDRFRHSSSDLLRYVGLVPI